MMHFLNLYLCTSLEVWRPVLLVHTVAKPFIRILKQNNLFICMVSPPPSLYLLLLSKRSIVLLHIFIPSLLIGSLASLYSYNNKAISNNEVRNGKTPVHSHLPPEAILPESVTCSPYKPSLKSHIFHWDFSRSHPT